MRPLWQTILFFSVATTLWSLLHVYAWRRLVRPTRAQLAPWLQRTAMGVFVALAVLAPVAMIAGRVPTTPLVSGVRWLGYLVVGISALLLSFTLMRDLAWTTLRLTDGLARRWQRRRGARRERELGLLPADPGRRHFLFNATSAGVLATAGLGSAVGYYSARRRPAVRHVDVPVAGLHPDLDGLRIAQLSDVHVGPTVTAADLSAMVDAINAEKPDLVAITGDLVDGYPDDMAQDIASLSRLEATHGVFYCTGNHEYYWDGPGWCEAIAAHNVRVLNNTHAVLECGAAKLLVGGVTDIKAGKRSPGHASDPHAAIAGAPEVDFRIALAHQPNSLFEVSRAGFDLQLSGHTHGGQFFPFMLFVGLAHPFTAGLHPFEAMQIFVSTGAGYWGPPQRLGVPSELPILTLRRA